MVLSSCRLPRLATGAFLLLGLAAGSPAQPPLPEPFAPVEEFTQLEDVGTAVAGWQRGDDVQFFAPLAPGGNDDSSGATVNPGARHANRVGCFMHCPYKQGAGVTFQEIQVRLPFNPAATLRGFTAMSDGTAQSDGVTYSIRINGKVAWSEHRRGTEWQPLSVNLSEWAGRLAVIRFEVSPGPAGDTSFDWSFWGGRVLELPGWTPPARNALSMPPLDLRNMSSLPGSDWAPLTSFKGGPILEVSKRRAQLRYLDPSVDLRYTWEYPCEGDPDVLGDWTLQAIASGSAPSLLRLLRDAKITWTEPVSPTGCSVRRNGESLELVRHYAHKDGRVATVTASVRFSGKSLVFMVRCDAPWIERFSPGDWGPVAVRRRIPIPYYSHAVYYLPAEDLFVSRFPDWNESHASRFDDAQAVYLPLTDGKRNLLHEKYIFVAASHLDETFANIPNPPSPWRAELGRRTVLDIWHGGSFDDVARGLNDITAMGVRGGLILLHVWQRDGYDNGLPAHWPARAEQGGEDAMRRLSDAARRLDYRLALHENYVDYYPNYEHYTTNDISLDSTGGLIRAWFNPGTKIQSFAIKPAVIARLAKEQSPEIHRRYGTTAGYLDVHSCVPPWFHVDQEAATDRAGSIQSVLTAHKELWAYHRKIHRGPVTGEGNGHWFWSGWLDGVEAQFGTGWTFHEGLETLLLVDFDLLRIHPLQLNHGQGYYSRWLEGFPEKWGPGMPMAILDVYRMQEVAFGHAAFLGDNFWRMPGYAALEHHLVTPVAMRHATARVRDIRYRINQRWVDSTTAAKAGRFNQVQVTYDNGLTITANGDVLTTLEVAGETLPPFGWVATQGQFRAGTVLRNGVVTDFREEPGLVFANARRASDWMSGAPAPITVSLAGFSGTNRTLRFSYNWLSQAPVRRDVTCFVHFDEPGSGDEGSRIVVQQDHALPKPLSAWSVGELVSDGPYELRLPEAVQDGRYTWYIGLFDKQGRLNIPGPNDGGNRLKLGYLVVSDGGRDLRLEPESNPREQSWDLWTMNLNTNEKVVDFGFLKTDGAVFAEKTPAGWVQHTWPTEGVKVELNPAKLPAPASRPDR